jgi:hypothetical protein
MKDEMDRIGSMHGTGEKYTKDEMDRIGGMHAWER